MRRGLISIAIFVAFAAIFTLSRHLTATTTTSVATTTTSVSASTTTSATSSTTCTGSAFTGTFNQGQGAAGTVYASITLTKSTAGTCTVNGWPTLTLQDTTGGLLPVSLSLVPSSGNAVQFLVPQANKAPATLTLHQGSTANFSLAYSQVQTGATACESAATISVQFSKNQSSVAVTPAYPITPCNNGKIWVSPFY